MRLSTFGLFAVLFSFLIPQYALSFNLSEMPPVVVKTFPVAGAENVDPNLGEISVTFSKDMTDGNWSWAMQTKESFPELIGQPKYRKDKRTNVIKVKLRPNKTYVLWINSQKFQNFKDLGRRPAIPYLLSFKTRS